MTPDEPPKDPEHEAVVGEAAGGEDSAGAAGGDAGVDGVEGVAAADSTADGRAEGASADGPPTEVSVSSGEAALASPAAGGRSGGRRRPWRTVAIGLGAAVGVAGIAVLSVFIYSIFDDDSGGWSTYEYSIVDDDSGGWFGYAPGRLDEDRRFDRDDERGGGRDRPVEGPRHDEGAGRAGDKGRPGSSAGHPDGTGGDKADGYGDAGRGRRIKGLCRGQEPRSPGVAAVRPGTRRRQGCRGAVEGLRGATRPGRPRRRPVPCLGRRTGVAVAWVPLVAARGRPAQPAEVPRRAPRRGFLRACADGLPGDSAVGDVARRRRRIRDRVRHTVRGVREVLHRSSSPS